MVQDAVEHGRDQHLVAHELLPLRYLLVGGEHHRGALVSIRDEAEEAVGLLLGDGRVADLVDDDELAFPEVAQAEARLAVDVGLVQDIDERIHLLEGGGVAAVDGEQPQPQSDHRLPQAGRAGEHDVAVGVEPVELLEPLYLACRDSALQLGGVELVDRLHARREVRRSVVALALPGEPPLGLGRQHSLTTSSSKVFFTTPCLRLSGTMMGALPP